MKFKINQIQRETERESEIQRAKYSDRTYMTLRTPWYSNFLPYRYSNIRCTICLAALYNLYQFKQENTERMSIYTALNIYITGLSNDQYTEL